MKIFWNVIIILSHIVGIMFIEACCASKLVWYYDWTVVEDIFIFLSTASIIIAHYVLITRKSLQKFLCKSSIYILTAIELSMFAITAFFILMPNEIVNIKERSQCLFIGTLQLLLVVSRFVYWWFLRKKSHNI